MKVQITVVAVVLKRKGQEKASILESKGLRAKMIVTEGRVQGESQNHSGKSRRHFILHSIFCHFKDLKKKKATNQLFIVSQALQPHEKILK